MPHIHRSRTERPEVWILPVLTLLWTLAPRTDNIGSGLTNYPFLAATGLVAAGLLVGLIARNAGTGRRRGDGKPGPLIPTAGLLLWAACSVAWSATAPGPALATVAMASLTALLPWVASTRAGLDPEVLMRRTGGAAIAGSAVHAMSLVLTGRLDPFEQRLALPLGGASSSGIPLVLAVATQLDRRARAAGRWPTVLALTGCLLILLTGSRAATAACLVVLTVALLDRPGPRTTLRTAALAAAALALPVGLLLSRPTLGFGDPARAATWHVALNGWRQDAVQIIGGTGLGEVWPWWRLEADRSVFINGSVAWESPVGVVLYHPHSLYVGTTVELGLVGVLLLGLVLWPVARAAASGLRAAELPATGTALLVSLLMLTVEHLLLRGFAGSLVWWTCAWVMCRIAPVRGPLRWPRPARGGSRRWVGTQG